MEYYGCKTFNSTFKNDAARLWNLAPAVIKNSVSLYSAKSQIKKFALTLPLKKYNLVHTIGHELIVS